jgi:hypothetical protein
MKAGLKAPAQSLVHVRWMSISITNQFLPKGVLLRDLLQTPNQSGPGKGQQADTTIYSLHGQALLYGRAFPYISSGRTTGFRKATPGHLD